LARKGIDILLVAYREAFSAGDPVCLTIVSQYEQPSFSGLAMLEGWNHNELPCLEWHRNKPFSDEDIIKMTAGASAYVSLYRSEGFGLPAVQAMALGVPLIITRGGASDDYASEATAFMVDSQETVCEELPCKGKSICVLPECLELTDFPTWRQGTFLDQCKEGLEESLLRPQGSPFQGQEGNGGRACKVLACSIQKDSPTSLQHHRASPFAGHLFCC